MIGGVAYRRCLAGSESTSDTPHLFPLARQHSGVPFTPVHLAPGLLLGLLTLRWLDLPTVLLASVLVDVRTALVFFDVLDGPLHGPLHTLLGATLLALVIAVGVLPVRSVLDPVLGWLRVPQTASIRRIGAGAVVGTWGHVLLDATLYADMVPFAPVAGNPLLGLLGVGTVYVGCLVAGIVGCGLYGMTACGLVALPTSDAA